MCVKRIIKLSFLTFCFLTLLSCGANKELTTASENTKNSEVEIKKRSLYTKLEENNHLSIEDRIALYRQLKKEHFDEYDFKNDRELNQYGYSLLSENKIKEAIEIFKLLVAEFPELGNAYDSLAEGYLEDGNEELALLNYEKAVELDPKNTHAIDQVTILKGLEILDTDWGKEFFHFPLHFAESIPYEGVEEVVFPKNWIKADSADFWSYVFVWELGNRKMVTPEELETNLELYFDGLMGVVKDDKDQEIMKTSVNFTLNEDPSDSVFIVGDLMIFDAFATNTPLNLNARIFSNYCEERGKLILLFQFSPQSYTHEVWDLLRTVLVRKSICEE